MTGSLVNRGKNRWALVLDLGYATDAAGKRTRKQKWISFRGTRTQAGVKLTELVRAANRNEFVEPSKLTLVDWSRTWLEKSVKPLRRPETYRVYGSFIEQHVAKAPVGLIPLQKLTGSDLERFYADLTTLSPASLQVLAAIVHTALKKAVRDKLITNNPAIDLEHRRPTHDHAAAREHCWSAVEARRFLATTGEADAQTAAFFALALDTGARRSELPALTWADVDLDTGLITISKQLDEAGAAPVFGPTKTKQTRSFSLGDETLTLLRAHKKAQASLKMKNRKTYKDFNLIFAREPKDLTTPKAALGQPLETLSGYPFVRLMKAAKVKKIKFHGLRHTSITLALAAGVPVHVVSRRVGHKNVAMTLNIYSHALPDMQQDAAAKLAAVLHG